MPTQLPPPSFHEGQADVHGQPPGASLLKAAWPWTLRCLRGRWLE